MLKEILDTQHTLVQEYRLSPKIHSEITINYIIDELDSWITNLIGTEGSHSYEKNKEYLLKRIQELKNKKEIQGDIWDLIGV